MAFEEISDGKSLFSTALSWLGFSSLAGLAIALLSRGTKSAEGKDIFDFLPTPVRKVFDTISNTINGWLDSAGSWLSKNLGLDTAAAAAAPATISTTTTTEASASTSLPAPNPTPSPPAPRGGAMRRTS